MGSAELSRMLALPKGVFGNYLDAEAIENLKKYSYKSCGNTFIDNLLNPWWDFVVEHLTPEVSSLSIESQFDLL